MAIRKQGMVVLYARCTHASSCPAMPWQWSLYGLRCDSACGNRLALAESTVNNRTIGPELQVAMAKISSFVE